MLYFCDDIVNIGLYEWNGLLSMVWIGYCGIVLYDIV